MSVLHVAVGVIQAADGRVLIALRPNTVHQGGLWEFPGGKLEQGESVEQALSRELNEELGIHVLAVTPLIKIKHQYPDLAVLLDVYRVTEFSGEAFAREGQAIKWVEPTQLLDYPFPAANLGIISAVNLPVDYAILNGDEVDQLMSDLQIILNKGVTLVQARVKALNDKDILIFIRRAKALCKKYGAELLINSAVNGWQAINVDGVHLTSADLMALSHRPNAVKWVAASCHNEQELQHAEKIGVDFVLISPVLVTDTCPNSKPLGWNTFEKWVTQVNLPVFALGGMQEKDRCIAQLKGGQGIAGISLFCH